MSRKTRLLTNALLLLSLLLVAACGRKTPTPGPDAVYTSAAETVQARLKTQGPPTAEPTTTPFEFKTPTKEAAPTKPANTLPPANQPTAALAATGTPAVPDRAVWVAQSPTDGSTIPVGSTFKMIWTVKNTGTTTWSTAYQLRFWAGEKFSSPGSVNLPKEVKPNDQVDISLNLTAPNSVGEYHGIWVITTSGGGNFYPLDVSLKVGNLPTATLTAATTATATTAASCDTDPSLCPTPTSTAEAGGE